MLGVLGIKQRMRPRVEDGGWRLTGKKRLDNNLITVVISVPKIKYRGLWEYIVGRPNLD